MFGRFMYIKPLSTPIDINEKCSLSTAKFTPAQHFPESYTAMPQCSIPDKHDFSLISDLLFQPSQRNVQSSRFTKLSIFRRCEYISKW